MRIAVIGGGVSGLAAAKTLMAFGHEVAIFERSAEVGGIWATAYPGVTLQNVAEHYRFTDFPWPFVPALHPTADEVRRYLDAAVEHYRLDILFEHKVLALSERPDGWTVTIESAGGVADHRFDYVVIATGQYNEPLPIELPERAQFGGEVVTERELRDLAQLADKRVIVVGFGKTAVDIATFAAQQRARVTHLFRAPRWLLPREMFGRDLSLIVPTRNASQMMPSWFYPWPRVAALHRRMPLVTGAYWWAISLLFRAATGLHPLYPDRDARRRIAQLEPGDPLTYQMRAAIALAPPGYYSAVAKGEIDPVCGEIANFTADGVRLGNGRDIAADVVVLARGSSSPGFHFLPEPYRTLMTATPGGTQLFRHMIHPRIPRLAFAGYNHGYFHIPAVEVATVWLAALVAGDLALPEDTEMEASMRRVAQWKAEHMLFEPAQAYGIGGRIHHYFDTLLKDLGLNPQRKSSRTADRSQPYWAADYADVAREYREARERGGTWPRPVLPLDT